MPNVTPSKPGRLRRYGGYAAKGVAAGFRGSLRAGEAANSFLNKVNPILNKATMPASKFVNSRFSPGLMTMAAVGFSGYSAMASYDPRIHDSRASEVAKNVIANDMVALGSSALAFKISPLAGAALMGAELMGVGPSQLVRQGMDSLGRKFDKERFGGTIIQQNENTMRATSQNLSLLGQAGYGGNEIINPQSFAARKRGLLGSEAMLMHN